MRSLEQLENKKRIKHEKANQQNPDMEMEEEKERVFAPPINVNKSIFDQDMEKNFGGINTQPSVFDRHTTFFTKPSK